MRRQALPLLAAFLFCLGCGESAPETGAEDSGKAAASSEREVEDGESSDTSTKQRAEITERLQALSNAKNEIEEARALHHLRGWLDKARMRNAKRLHLHLERSDKPGTAVNPSELEAWAAEGEWPELTISYPYLPPVTPWTKHKVISADNLRQLAQLAR